MIIRTRSVASYRKMWPILCNKDRPHLGISSRCELVASALVIGSVAEQRRVKGVTCEGITDFIDSKIDSHSAGLGPGPGREKLGTHSGANVMAD